MKEKFREDIILGAYHIIQQKSPRGFSLNVREKNSFEYIIRIDDYNRPPHIHCSRYDHLDINPKITMNQTIAILKEHIIENIKINEEKLYEELL